MRFLSRAKDGGPESTVTGYWLIELKKLFSIVLLRFDDGSRDSYHEHAFDSLNWVLRGKVIEHIPDVSTPLDWPRQITYRASIIPIVTRRKRLHRVVSEGTTWVLSIRGPWRRTWRELDPKTWGFTTLTHGRRIVDG